MLPTIDTIVAAGRVAAVRKHLGDLANARGKANEYLLLDLVGHLRESVPWIRDARIATPEEDARGIDVVVNTDVGQLFLQAKSSRRGAKLFTTKQRTAMIGVVVVQGERSLNRARATLSDLRAAVQRRRGER